MHPKRLVWYIFPWYLVIILVSLVQLRLFRYQEVD